jgi:tripartite-type tricarboxylate transporter receptor subunit TctC
MKGRIFMAGASGLSKAFIFTAFVGCVGAAPSLAADEPRPFYQGKTMQIVVGFDPGGGYDAYARLIGRAMSKYIPGNPTVIVQNMPGAGSRVAANWLYNVAPRDGTAIGSVVQSTPVDQVLKEPGVQFDAAQFNWIGNPIVDNLVTLSWAASGLQTLEDVKAKGGLICGSSGGGPTVTFPNTINKLLGANTRVVSGYPGVSAVMLAMQRGEVNCNGGQAWSSMKATMGQMMRDGQLKVLVQWGTQAEPEISSFAGYDVPLITAYAQTDLDRSALRLITSTAALSRPLLAPPGLPADRVEMLRQAFDQTMKDPAFLEEAAKGKMDIKPISGAAIQTLVKAVVQTPEADIKRAIELTQ